MLAKRVEGFTLYLTWLAQSDAVVHSLLGVGTPAMHKQEFILQAVSIKIQIILLFIFSDNQLFYKMSSSLSPSLQLVLPKNQLITKDV